MVKLRGPLLSLVFAACATAEAASVSDDVDSATAQVAAAEQASRGRGFCQERLVELQKHQQAVQQVVTQLRELGERYGRSKRWSEPLRDLEARALAAQVLVEEQVSLCLKATRITNVATGSVACVLTAEGVARCASRWGQAASTPDGLFTKIDAGKVACGLHDSGNLECWDLPKDMVDRGSKYGPLDLSAVSGARLVDFDLGAGRNHGCGITDLGELRCWGGEAPALSGVAQVSVGYDHSCALLESGAVRCWGSNKDTWRSQVVGKAASPSGAFVQVDANYDHSCAITTSGNAVCWGWYMKGVQQDVPEGTFSKVVVGQEFACGLRSTAEIACWGVSAPPAPEGRYLCTGPA
jgi:hypothetical protein